MDDKIDEAMTQISGIADADRDGMGKFIAIIGGLGDSFDEALKTLMPESPVQFLILARVPALDGFATLATNAKAAAGEMLHDAVRGFDAAAERARQQRESDK